MDCCFPFLWEKFPIFDKCFPPKQRHLVITCPLHGTGERISREHRRSVFSEKSEPWRTFCPSCCRPIDVSIKRRILEPENKPPRHAYVVAMWGYSPTYVLGAMVLGKSLLLTGTKKDLVVLHTSDVIGLDLLRKVGWKTVLIDEVESTDALFGGTRGRFSRVFNKLHLFGLTQYDKVCMLDIDMLVTKNIDDVFDVSAPAAMRRNHAKITACPEQNEPIHGGSFFYGGDPNATFDNTRDDRYKTWYQSGGINAGIMVFRPNQATLDNMLQEVRDPNHPSHMQCPGPEQDYLTRYFADQWSNLAVEYNFQLHQLFFGLHPSRVNVNLRAHMSTQGIERIKVIHYSGSEDMKPWSFAISLAKDKEKNQMTMEEFTEYVLSTYSGYNLWVKRCPLAWAHSRDGGDVDDLELRPDGSIFWTSTGYEADIPKDISDGASKLVRDSIIRWMEIFNQVEAELGINVVNALFAENEEVKNVGGFESNMKEYEEARIRMRQETQGKSGRQILDHSLSSTEVDDEDEEAMESTEPSTEDGQLYIRTEPPKWSSQGSYWGTPSWELEANVYRTIVMASDDYIRMFLVHGEFTSKAPICIYQPPYFPREFYKASALYAFLGDTDKNAFLIIGLRSPYEETLSVLHRWGITYANEFRPTGHYVVIGSNRPEQGWQGYFDDRFAFSSMNIRIYDRPLTFTTTMNAKSASQQKVAHLSTWNPTTDAKPWDMLGRCVNNANTSIIERGWYDGRKRHNNKERRNDDNDMKSDTNSGLNSENENMLNEEELIDETNVDRSETRVPVRMGLGMVISSGDFTAHKKRESWETIRPVSRSMKQDLSATIKFPGKRESSETILPGLPLGEKQESLDTILVGEDEQEFLDTKLEGEYEQEWLDIKLAGEDEQECLDAKIEGEDEQEFSDIKIIGEDEQECLDAIFGGASKQEPRCTSESELITRLTDKIFEKEDPL